MNSPIYMSFGEYVMGREKLVADMEADSDHIAEDFSGLPVVNYAHGRRTF